jgi:hypothetical protein
MTTCFGCHGAIGPTERRECPTYRHQRGNQLTNRDMAVFVLEASEEPLSLYDIRRGMQREFGWAPEQNSLNATVATDCRACWAGRGLYGLWRHGLVPGPRKLADVAQLALYCHDQPLDLDEVAFALRHLGYRFQPASLYRVLTTTPSIKRSGWTSYTFHRSAANAAALRSDLGLGRAFKAVTERTKESIVDALNERRRRLASDRGLAHDDPIYVEGEVQVLEIY